MSDETQDQTPAQTQDQAVDPAPAQTEDQPQSGSQDRPPDKHVVRSFLTEPRFPGHRGGENWVGPLVDYKEIELMRRQLTSSSKLMSRKRTGANTQEQRALKEAVKRARFLALVPYSGT